MQTHNQCWAGIQASICITNHELDFKILCVMLFMCTAHAKDDSMLVDQVKFGKIYSKRYKLECEKQTNTFDQSIWLTGESFGSFLFFLSFNSKQRYILKIRFD